MTFKINDHCSNLVHEYMTYHGPIKCAMKHNVSGLSERCLIMRKNLVNLLYGAELSRV